MEEGGRGGPHRHSHINMLSAMAPNWHVIINVSELLMHLSSICVCVFLTCVRVQTFVILHVYQQPHVILRLKTFTLSCLLHSLSAMRTNVILEPGAKLSCCKAPAQPSYLLISSCRGQGVRQGRAAALRCTGADTQAVLQAPLLCY